ncbi:MAG: CAP domain-containing protein [Candidatus Acidiferrales bacterium]
MSTPSRRPMALPIALLAAVVCLPLAAYSQQYMETRNWSDETNRLETQMWEMVNHDRTSPAQAEETKGRARPLVWDARLATAARAHSDDMARTGFFSHTGPDGSLPAQRVSLTGVRWLSIGENIAMVDDVVRAEALFMDEPKFQSNHRGNILNPNYTHVGIGIARGQDGLLYITQEFAQLR